MRQKKIDKTIETATDKTRSKRRYNKTQCEDMIRYDKKRHEENRYEKMEQDTTR